MERSPDDAGGGAARRSATTRSRAAQASRSASAADVDTQPWQAMVMTVDAIANTIRLTPFMANPRTLALDENYTLPDLM